MKEHHPPLIAQSKNGSGKTGAFSIGSTLRVDRSDKKSVQVIVLCETRELCNQVAAVYEKLTKDTGITVSNFQQSVNSANIIVSTLGKLINTAFGGKKAASISLKNLKCLVLDEADVYFKNDRDFADMKKLVGHKDLAQRSGNPLQFILFSATYLGSDANPEEVNDRIAMIVPEAV